jgi:hypothetical protein
MAGSLRAARAAASMEQRPAEAISLESLIDGEAADETRGEQFVARQALRHIGGQLRQRNACRRECVIAGDHPVFGERNETIAHATFDILRRELAQIAVEWLDAAGKALAIMDGGQDFENRWLTSAP